MTEIVPATEEMIRSVTNEPWTRTVRAVAAVDGDRVLGVAGIYPENGHLIMFSGIAPEARAEIHKHKKTLVRCARRVFEMAITRRMPIAALADDKYEGSESMLRHFGFIHVGKGIYKWQPPYLSS